MAQDLFDKQDVGKARKAFYIGLMPEQLSEFSNMLEIMLLDTAQAMTNLEMPNDIYNHCKLKGVSDLLETLRGEANVLIRARKAGIDIAHALYSDEDGILQFNSEKPKEE